jgi:hypothetical protein
MIDPTPALLIHLLVSFLWGFIASHGTPKKRIVVPVSILLAIGCSVLWGTLNSELNAAWRDFLWEPVFCGGLLFAWDSENVVGVLFGCIAPIAAVMIALRLRLWLSPVDRQITIRSWFVLATFVSVLSAVIARQVDAR